MNNEPVELAGERKAHFQQLNHPLYCLIGLGVALVWSALGCGIAFFQGVVRHFLGDWSRLQGFFLLALGTWLILLVRSGTLEQRVSALVRSGFASPIGIRNRRLRAAVVAAIALVGTASLIAMGFNASGPLLLFMWITCACVCSTAAIVTLHAIDVTLSVHRLQAAEIKVFRYSPARTPELRELVNYFTSFTLLMTLGYACALAATLYSEWRGNNDFIAAVRVFWPLLYVPACSIVMIFPHVVVHRLIRREKDRTLFSCQQEMDQLLVKYPTLNSSEIERTNALAQMFDRISATPNYVVDIGIAVRTSLPLAFNLLTLFAKALVNRG